MKMMKNFARAKREKGMIPFAIAVFAVAPILVAVAADSDYTAATGYVTMKATDANQNSSSFAAAGNWSDNQAPHNDTNYYVRSGYTLYTPAKNATFSGKTLVVGGYLRTANAYTYTFGNTIFLPGSRFRFGQISTLAAGGSFTIQGTEASPVLFESLRGSDSEFRLSPTLVSDENGWMVLVGQSGYAGRQAFSFRGGSWAGFQGTAEVRTNCAIRLEFNTPFGNAFSAPTAGTVLVRSGGCFELFARGIHPGIGRLVVESGGELCPTQALGSSYFAITKRLELAEGSRVVCSNTFNIAPVSLPTCGVFRLSADAVAAGIPNLSKVEFVYPNTTMWGRLPRFIPVVYDDSEVSGGKYAGWSMKPVVSMTKANYGVHYALSPASGETAADYWSDGEFPHEGADYFIQNAFFISGKGYPYTFPGDSCTVKSGVTFGLTSNMRTIRFDDLTFLDNVLVRPLNNAPYILRGKLSLLKRSNPSSPVVVNCANAPDQTLKIESEIDGDNDIVFRRFGETLSTERAEVYLSGLNTNYTGRIIVKASAEEGASSGSVSDTLDAVNTLTLHISDARNLGGALAAFDADSLVVSNKCRLAVDVTTTFNETTRGWHFPADAYLRINSGMTATCANTLTVGGELVKEGTGTLRLSARPVAENASARLTISSGDLAVSATDALNGLPITLASGSSLVIDREAGDATFTEKGLNLVGVSISSADAKVPVRFTFDAVNLDVNQQCHSFPVMTYPSTQSTAVASTYEFKKPDAMKGMGYALETVERDNGDGTVTLDIRLVRKGTQIILR